MSEVEKKPILPPMRRSCFLPQPEATLPQPHSEPPLARGRLIFFISIAHCRAAWFFRSRASQSDRISRLVDRVGIEEIRKAALPVAVA